MPPEESRYPSDWFRIAEKDLDRVKRLLDLNDIELAGFCLQQAMEKFLKGFLLSQGWQLRKIHNLDTLLDDAVTYDTSLEKYRRVCQKITLYYFVERYPLVTETGITKDDVFSSLEQVKNLIIKLRTKISEK